MQEDLRLIFDFFSNVKAVLNHVYEYREEYLPSNLQPMFDLLKDVFQRIDDTLVSLEQNWETYETELAMRGLTGAHLKYKIEGFRAAFERWDFLVDKELILRVLDWINVVLGSFATLFPGLEAVKEFKETLEQGIQEYM